jgi:hypothetical protein
MPLCRFTIRLEICDPEAAELVPDRRLGMRIVASKARYGGSHAANSEFPGTKGSGAGLQEVLHLTVALPASR